MTTYTMSYSNFSKLNDKIGPFVLINIPTNQKSDSTIPVLIKSHTINSIESRLYITPIFESDLDNTPETITVKPDLEPTITAITDRAHIKTLLLDLVNISDKSPIQSEHNAMMIDVLRRELF